MALMDRRCGVVVAVAVLALEGCHAPRPPLAAVPVVVASEQNADVIWVTRSVDVSSEEGTRTMSGLFACYRRPAAAPGSPTCYLSSYVWDPKALAWPAPATLARDGTLEGIGNTAGAAAAPPQSGRSCVDSNECAGGYECLIANGVGHCLPGGSH